VTNQAGAGPDMDDVTSRAGVNHGMEGMLDLLSTIQRIATRGVLGVHPGSTYSATLPWLSLFRIRRLQDQLLTNSSTPPVATLQPPAEANSNHLPGTPVQPVHLSTVRAPPTAVSRGVEPGAELPWVEWQPLLPSDSCRDQVRDEFSSYLNNAQPSSPGISARNSCTGQTI
jgi:hypothetical protein